MNETIFQEHQLFVNNKPVIFRVPERYQQLDIRGEGTFGTVCACIDTSKKDEQGRHPGRAIKKFKEPFKEPTKAKRVLREILILHHFTHDKVIKLLDVFYDPKYQEVYMVIELMKTDLNQIIRSININYPDHFITYIMYQICHAMAYIHSANILHRDLKPGNILINNNGSVRVCDLGLAVKEHTGMSVYVVTRCYRAPELLFKNPSTVRYADYGAAVDMWSVGCIFAELYLRRVLFHGQSYFDQLKKILEIVGLPDPELLSKMQPISSKAHMRMNEIIAEGKGKPIPWEQIIPNMSNDGYDLLSRMLCLDPEKRITAIQAIQHPYFKEIYKPTHLRTHDQRLEFSYERDDLTSADYRKYILDTIQSITQKKKPFGTELYTAMQRFVNTPLSKSTTSRATFEKIQKEPSPNPMFPYHPYVRFMTAQYGFPFQAPFTQPPSFQPLHQHHQRQNPVPNNHHQNNQQSVNPNHVNPSVNPNQFNHNPSLNPNQYNNQSVNPNHINPSVNPNHVHPSVNPNQFNPSVNPNQINPSVNPSVNPNLHPSVNPNHQPNNFSINPNHISNLSVNPNHHTNQSINPNQLPNGSVNPNQYHHAHLNGSVNPNNMPVNGNMQPPQPNPLMNDIQQHPRPEEQNEYMNQQDSKFMMPFPYGMPYYPNVSMFGKRGHP